MVEFGTDLVTGRGPDEVRKSSQSQSGSQGRRNLANYSHSHNLPYSSTTNSTMAARAVACLDVLLDSVGLGLGLCLLTYLSGGHAELSQEERGALMEMGFLRISSSIPSKFGVTLVVLYLIYMMTELLFAILLMIGISIKSTTLCNLWMSFALINLFVKGLQFVYFVALNKENFEGVISLLVEPLIRSAMFYVIYTHKHKLKRDEWDQGRRRRALNFYMLPPTIGTGSEREKV